MNLVYQQPLEQEKENIDNESILKEGKYKILIVEDNDSLREMLVNIFKSLYTVITAVNGKEGLEKRVRKCLILLSVTSLCRNVGNRTLPGYQTKFRYLPYSRCSVNRQTAIEHNLEGLKMGADDYITKPFNINILLSRCNNLVNNRIMLQEKFSKQPQIDTLILTNNILDKKFMDKVTEIIENEIDNVNFSVDQLVAQMGIARTKLFTKLKAITGQTPSDLIMTIRLETSSVSTKEQSELNISEISDRTGFNFPKYFSKCFKEKISCNSTSL